MQALFSPNFKKKVLLVCAEDFQDTVVELPYVFHRAGMHVTVMCPKRLRGYISSYVDRWINTQDDSASIIKHVHKETAATHYDFVFLADDYVLRGLVDFFADAGLDEDGARRFSPSRHPLWRTFLGSKIHSLAVLKKMGIPIPAFAIGHTVDEAIIHAQSIGFPVMIKQDRSSGGGGVRKCENVDDIKRFWGHVVGPQMLIEKYIDGTLLSADALYLGGQLAGYNVSEVTHTKGPTGISLRRNFLPAIPAVEENLNHIGEALNIQGFVNFSLIQETGSGTYYFFEIDMRPNAWFAYGRFTGADFSRALHLYTQHGRVNHIETANPALLKGGQKTISLFHREFAHILEHRNGEGLRYWLSNTQHCWSMMPFYDPRLLILQTWRALKKGIPWIKDAVHKKSD